MTDDPTARPLSGEIMAGAPRETERRMGERRIGERRAAADIVDAEFITIGPATPDWSGTAAEEPGLPRGQASSGIDILKSKPAGGGAQRGGPLFWVFGLCLVLASFWVSGGHALVSRPQAGISAAPQKAGRNKLRITNVTSRIERQGDRFFLLVDGEVANDGAAAAVLPGLEIRVAERGGRTTLYFLGTSKRRLEPGGRFAFSSRLETPKDGVETVTVDFGKEG